MPNCIVKLTKINITRWHPGPVIKKIPGLLGFLLLFSGLTIAQKTDTSVVRQWLAAGKTRVDGGEFEAAGKLADKALTALLPGKYPMLEAEVRMLRGEIAQAQGFFGVAEVNFDSAWCLVQDQAGWEHPQMATALSYLGNYYYELGYIETAWDYHTQALDIRQRLYGDQHPETAKSYNNLANCYLSTGGYAEAISLYRQVAAVRQTHSNVPASELASVYNNLGSVYLAAGDLANAKTFYLQAMDIRRQTLGPTHLKTAQSRQNLGNVFAALHQPDTALVHFGEALGVYMQYYGDRHPKVAALYENMGNALAEKQSYEAAGALHQQALLIRQQYYNQSHPDIIRSYQNIGELWMMRGDYLTALRHFRQALGSLREQWGDYHPQVAQAYEQVGLALLNTGEIQQGLQHLEQALALRQSLFGAGHPYVAGTYMNLGNACWQDGRHIQAREYYQNSLAIWSARGDSWRGEQLKAFLNISRSYLEEDQPTEAQQMLARAAAFLDHSDTVSFAGYERTFGEALREQGRYAAAGKYFDRALDLLRRYQTNRGLVSQKAPLEVLLSLQGKAWNALDWAHESRSREHADTALYWFEQAVELLTAVQGAYLDPEARAQMTALNQSLFSGAIESCFVLAEAGEETARVYGKAFAFSDRNKSLRLLEAGRLRRSLEKSGDLVRQLQNITLGINQLERDRTLGTLQLTDEETRTIDGKLFYLQEQRASLYRNLELFNGDAPGISPFPGAESISVFQEALAPDQALMTFFSGETADYQFLLSREGIEARRLDPDFPLHTAIMDMGRSVLQYPVAPTGEKPALDSLYIQNAHRLYQYLFQPLEALLEGKKTITVIPDGAFGWLPFEALLKTLPAANRRYRSYPYLIRDYNISYTYSAGYWLNQMQATPGKTGKRRSCLAVAPDFQSPPSEFPPLDHNKTEAGAIAQMFKGKVLSGPEASRTNFLVLAPQYAILHLATHAKSNSLNGDYAFLVLGKDPADTTAESLLYVKDLYGQDWQADLAVLSACETGIGSFRPGEGVVSLGRGFAQAGVRSTVNSLWSINDARTAELMETFYANLRKGMAKHEALRLAKMDYLTNSDHEAGHPFYWASYLPFGDMQPLEAAGGDFKWWYWALGLGLLVVVWRRVNRNWFN